MKLNSEARAIYKSIREEIKRRIQLKESLAYLDEFEPTNDKNEVLRRQAYFKENLPKIVPELKEILAKIKPIRFKKDFLHDRLLVVDESEIEKAQALGVCEVSTEPLEGYDLILSTIGIGIDVELSISEIAPELYIMPLWENRETLKALVQIGNILEEKSVAEPILEKLKELEEVMKRRELLDNLDELIAEEERKLNEKIAEKLEKFSLTLTGKELLEFLKDLREGNYEAIFKHFSEIESEILEEINEAEKRLSEKLNFTVELFSRENLYPVEVSPESIEALRRELERELKVEMYLKSREILDEIKHLIPKLREEINRAYELEFLRAVKEFTEGFAFPELIEWGIGFINGRHLFIKNPQPVSYVVGKVPIEFDGVNGERVVILTGANSGGKTSLLELISQIVILTHMGFPVNAEKAWVEVLDELFFFKRKRSIYGAGAFETALKSFVRALTSDGRKLILIDEFEAITEPGAAVKIIAELLKIAYEKGFYVIIVSHLGEDLKKELPFARVDGIEAQGLDENLNLIVDRQPKFGVLGKSTPELIVEKLYRTKRGKEKEIFERVWKAFT
ncbi:endonuclease MutS2 [Thermococcus sp. M39]|uniref:endonuclease MutS2 n=1 Tax=unclassified Thermococcus TaxID=2627626 RepID=UPI0014395736|nr:MULTISPECIES: endonuclease MutS2 [unclassified Thermococcus]NJE08799.1 endonuclease MutS2 [Thermococcus sp. M39]NJE12032.1 endonuclease MutS2 [Thermococcus sp. LS2]